MLKATSVHPPHWNSRLALLIVVVGAIALCLAFLFSGELSQVTPTHSVYSSNITDADFQAFSARYKDPTLRHFFDS